MSKYFGGVLVNKILEQEEKVQGHNLFVAVHGQLAGAD